MYLYCGNNLTLRQEDIICVCDLDNASQSYRTRIFLSRAESEGRVISASGEDLPRSFAVCAPRRDKTKKGVEKPCARVYLCQPNSSTLFRRAQSPFSGFDTGI